MVAIVTPFAGLAAGWVAGLVARSVPGVHLDRSQVTTFMVSAVVAVVGSGLKWLHGWQAHEARVAQGCAAPIKPYRGPATTPTPAAAIPAPARPVDDGAGSTLVQPALVEDVVIVEVDETVR